MSVTNTINYSVSSTSKSTSLSGSQDEVGSQEIVIDSPFPASSVNTAYAIAFTPAALQAIVLYSKKNMTILVNSTGSPDLTINLIANVPYVWQRSTGYFANPFPNPVTTFYVSCAAAATLSGKVLKT